MKIVLVEDTMPRVGRKKKNLEVWRRAVQNWGGNFWTGRASWLVDAVILVLGPPQKAGHKPGITAKLTGTPSKQEGRASPSSPGLQLHPSPHSVPYWQKIEM